MNRNDQMTPMERLGGFLTGGDMDRILAMPLICSMSGKMCRNDSQGKEIYCRK